MPDTRGSSHVVWYSLIGSALVVLLVVGYTLLNREEPETTDIRLLKESGIETPAVVSGGAIAPDLLDPELQLIVEASRYGVGLETMELTLEDGTSGYQVNYETEEDIRHVHRYYATAFRSRGWEVEYSVRSVTGLIVVRKGEQVIRLETTPRADAVGTRIVTRMYNH